MTTLTRAWRMGALLCALLTVFACSSKHKLVPGAPDWVNQGSGAFDDSGSRVFYGVGAVTGIASPNLAMQTADQRARADIARQLETFVAGLYRDYQQAGTADGRALGAEQQHVEESFQAITRISVRGARVVDHWRDTDTDTLYALARIDLAGLKASLDQTPEVDSGLRDYVRRNAEKSFDRLNAGGQ